MNRVQISPAALRGEVTVPPSKSAAHRALICAALSGAPCRITPHCESDDIRATLGALEALGANITEKNDGFYFGALQDGRSEPIDCGESGSTVRFLLPIAAALGRNVTFTGRGRLPERPLGPLTAALKAGGVQVSSDRLPLTIEGKLRPGQYCLPGDISSQYISGLLFASPLTGGDCEIALTTPLESTGYIDLTLQWMKRFGIRVEQTAAGYFIPGGQAYRATDAAIEGDWSQAGFFLAAGAIGGDITIHGLRRDSRQGDRVAADLISDFGAKVDWRGDTLCVKSAPLHGITIDASQIPDLVPALAVTAAFAKGGTVIHSAARLRLKESDRLSATAAGLKAMGVAVEEKPDGLLITGGRPTGAAISGENDHRIVMAFAVAAAFAKGDSTISDAFSTKKSYPTFFEDFEVLGGNSRAI